MATDGLPVLARQVDDPRPSARFLARESRGEVSPAEGRAYRAFLRRVVREILTHPVVVSNAYTGWFRRGEATDDDLRHFTVQFSVFSNQFLVAQLRKMIASDTLEGMRAAKEILANEIGCVFRREGGAPARTPSDDVDPDVVGTEGTVDGGTFRFRAAHFEWLVALAKPLGLTFRDVGRPRHATRSTRLFCEELVRVYGSDDPDVGSGAGFAIENWAAAGFWQELVDGLEIAKRSRHPDLHLGFWVWHERLEAQHAAHTVSELEDTYFRPGFREGKFLEGGRAMLAALSLFWSGLDRDRRRRPSRPSPRPRNRPGSPRGRRG